jgi:hypothetical protein
MWKTFLAVGGKAGSRLLLLLAGAVLLLGAGWYNGFPFVFSDTAIYIINGFRPEEITNRGIVYGFFLRHSSLAESVWFSALAQALILTALLWNVLQFFLAPVARSLHYWGVLFFLVFGASCSWVVSLLMPDIFTPIMILALALIAYIPRGKNKGKLLFAYGALVVSAPMHPSNGVTAVGLLAVLFFLRYQYGATLGGYYRLALALVLVVASNIGIYSYIGPRTYKNQARPFILGKLVENGMVERFLQENCRTGKEYCLCPYKDSLPPNLETFLFDPNSPFYKTSNWTANEKDFEPIISGILREPDYIVLHLLESFQSFCRQLTQVEVGEGLWAFGKESAPYQEIKRYFPYETAEFLNSKQMRGNEALPISFCNRFYFGVLVVSVFVVLRGLWAPPGGALLSSDRRLFILSLLMGILWNAFSTATFGTVAPRLQTRVVWLLPLAAYLILAHYSEAKRAKIFAGSVNAD